jgi:hypothetical protein
LQTINGNDKSKAPKKKHAIKLHVNFTLDDKVLPFASIPNSLKDIVSEPKEAVSQARVSQDSAEALKSILGLSN